MYNKDTEKRFIKKEKKLKKENEKVANQKLGNLGNLGNLRNIISSFLISEFLVLPYSQNRKLGFKNLDKEKFRDFRGFRVFNLASKIGMYRLLYIQTKNTF